MSGYRQHRYDPNAYQQSGRPLRPYNWVQWAGAVLVISGALLSSLDLAGKAGWIPRWVEDPSPWALILLILGIVLINSRRGPSTLVGTPQLEKNRRLLLITIAICAAVLGAALAIDFA